MILSNISRSIKGTLGRRLLKKSMKYEGVLNFALGDPDIPTPYGICKAAVRSIIEHKTHYTPAGGIAPLREAVAKNMSVETGLPLTADNVAITIGATEAIHLAFRMLLNPGDEVIIIGPSWTQCANNVLLCSAKPIVTDRFTEGFLPDIDHLRSLVTDRTKIIVVNSPNNPTGTVYPKEILQAIAGLAHEKGICLFSDEVYASLTFDKPFESVAQWCDRDNVVVFSSFSKNFSMTGWRVGCVISEPKFIKRLIMMQENVAICASAPSQWAALEAVTHAEKYEAPIRKTFRKRRQVLIEALKDVPKIRFACPDATFYLFVDISATGLDSRTFSDRLLEQEQVAVTPGLSFGETFDGYVRLAFTLNEDALRECAVRIRRFIESLDRLKP